MKHHATILLLFIAPSSSSCSSSTNTNSKSHQNILLKLQSRYNSKPPHSKSLYNILDLNSNCTSEQIVKAYRRKSRDYHPDKFDGDPQKLEQVREAYEVLRKDETRLPYHTFGVLGGDVKSAVDILTGEVSPSSSSSDKKDDESIKELLSLMGYDGHISNNHRENVIFQSNNLPPPPPPSSHQQQHSQSHIKKNSSLQKQKQNQRRMSVIESDLKELVRPLIEGQITQEQMAHLMVQKSQSLKQIPLGPQILRCVGRAYRRAGQLCLSNNNNSLYHNQRNKDRIKQHLNSDKSLKLLLNTSQHKIKGSIRSAKHFAEAAFATGKLLYTEQKEKSRLLMLSNKNKKKSNDKKQIEYYENNRDEEDFYMNSFSASGSSSSSSSSGEEDNFMFDDDFLFDESNINGDNDDEQEQQQSKEEQVIHKAIIQILQIEALWKITKIELDRIVFDACTRLLKIRGRNNKNNNHHHHYHGYISTTSGGAHQQHHEVISSDIMRLRAASALILIGDVYVRCSKEGTSWMD